MTSSPSPTSRPPRSSTPAGQVFELLVPPAEAATARRLGARSRNGCFTFTGDGPLPAPLRRFAPDRFTPAWAELRLQGACAVMPPGSVTLRPHQEAARDAIHVLPAPGRMTIDGRLDEWSPTAVVRRSHGEGRSLDGWMMYDDRHLYIAAHFGDPLPLRNAVNPALYADSAWRGGAVQGNGTSVGHCHLSPARARPAPVSFSPEEPRSVDP